MKPILSLLCTLCALCGHASAASESSKPPVDLTVAPTTVTLANRELRLAFNKKTGRLESLTHGGRELLTRGGGYIQIAFDSRQKTPQATWGFRVVRRTAELVEIAFVNTNPQCPLDFAAHYVLRAGDSGFYNYLAWGHDAARSPGVVRLAQYNFCLRVDPMLFTVAAVDDQRITPFPRPELLTPQRMVMDATYRLPDGRFYSKYFFSVEMDERHTVHGTMGGGRGIWIIMPSHEHLNGGPEHQELTVHQTDSTPVLLCHATAAHYGAGVATSDSKDGSWSKVSTPWFVYVNTAATQAELWKDAKSRAAQEVAAWPYRWLDDASFQLHRGGVAGRLAFDDNNAADGARVILADHEEKPLPLFWQQQWRGYRFYGWADQHGRFAIGKIRPGLYDLYAWRPGAFGQYVKRSVRVSAGETANLGELRWSRPGQRETLWQIGVPDRSAQEFGFGDDFRQWGLWDQIAAATPGGVTFVVGKSRERDWPFEMAVTQAPDLSWRLPEWRIQFGVAAPRSGRAVLTLGIAAYEGRQGAINVSLNGEPIGLVSGLEQDGAAHRSGVHGAYQEREIVFDAARLRGGTNTLTLSLPSPGRTLAKPSGYPAAAVLWDCLRLEVSPGAGRP